MKKLLLLVCLILGGLSMNAQEISTEQWALITKKTADWCPNCGQWGWTFKKNMIADQAGKPTIIWSAHHSGGLKTETSAAIVNNLPSSGGQPVFYANNDNWNVVSGNMSTRRDELNAYLAELALFPPLAGVGSSAVFDGTKITNTAKVRFLTDLEPDANGGKYLLASYLVDDILVAYQASQGDNAEHQNILLHSFNGDNHFGISVADGEAIATDQEFTVEGELDFSGDSNIPNYADGYSVVTILWADVGSNLRMFNANKQLVTGISSNNNVLENVSIAAFHLGAGQVNLNVTSDKVMSDVTINLYDINGRIVSTKTQININEGNNQVILDAQNLTLGTYVVNIQSELGNKSLKVSVR